jgi:hypothetical protein
VVINEVLHPIGRGDEVVHLQGGPVRLPAAHAAPGNLHCLGDCGLDPGRDRSSPRLWKNPTVDDEYTAGVEMGGHVSHGLIELAGGGHIADGAEQAHDRVEATPEAQAAHVRLDQLHPWKLRASVVEHGRVEVHPDDVVAVAKMYEMASRTAGHVEQRGRARLASLDQMVKLTGLGRVVLPSGLVDQVVEVRGVSEHGVARTPS